MGFGRSIFLSIAAATVSAQAALADCTFMLNFDTGSFVLSASDTLLLDKIVANYPNAPMRITGHTDLVGSAAANEILSFNRATAVHNYIVTHGGTNAQIVKLEGDGETRPIVASTGPEVANRRVELMVPGCRPEVIARTTTTGAVGGLSTAAVLGGAAAGLLLLGVLGDSGNGTSTTTTTGN